MGADIAKDLAQNLQEMGLPGIVATSGTSPQINDIVIRGYLVRSIKETRKAPCYRIRLGFIRADDCGQGYVMTPQGLHKLGFGHVASGGSKTPGAAVPAVVAIASGNPVGLIVSSGMKIYWGSQRQRENRRAG